jgi:hypothetical protein
MATDVKADPSSAAFFRWQEWQAARRHVAPTTEEARGDLLAAEAEVLAAAGERDAARDAAALARAHYEAADPSPPVKAKIRKVRALWRSLGGPVEVVDLAVPDVVVNPQELTRRIERLVAGLTARQAGGLLKTINALAGTDAWGATDPLAVQVVAVPVQPRGHGGADVNELVSRLGALRRYDPAGFGRTLAQLWRQAGVDPQLDPGSANGPEGDEWPSA